MTEQTNDEEKLTDYDRQQMKTERQRARLFLEEEQKIQHQQAEGERWAGISRMSAVDFARFKREAIAKSEAAKATKQAEAAKKQQQG
jgi:hypothetical protein